MGIYIIHDRDQTGPLFICHGTGFRPFGSLEAAYTQKKQFIQEAGKVELISVWLFHINIPDFRQAETESFIGSGIPAGTIEETEIVKIRNMLF